MRLIKRSADVVLMVAVLSAIPTSAWPKSSSFNGAWSGTLVNYDHRYAVRLKLGATDEKRVEGTIELIRIGGGHHARYSVSATVEDETLTYRTTDLMTSSNPRWCLPGGYLRREVDGKGVVSLAGRLQENVRGGGCPQSVKGALILRRAGN